jgi:predicted phosphodiesterase
MRRRGRIARSATSGVLSIAAVHGTCARVAVRSTENVDRPIPGWYALIVATARPYVRRVGVIGDVHAEDRRLEGVLGFFVMREVDRVLVVGDLVDGYGDVARTLMLLEEAGVDAVRGNHERWFLAGEERGLRLATQELPERAVAYLHTLPATRRYETPRGGLMLGHGVGDDDMSFLRPDTIGYGLQDITTLRELMLDPEIQYYIGGHTHLRMVRAFAGLVVVNAGTLFRDDEAVVALVDFEREEVQFHAVDDDGAPRPLERHVLPRPLPLHDHGES